MTDSHGTQTNEKLESLWKYSNNLRLSINLSRFIGYGLLVLAALDLVQIFAFSEFTNPAWEFGLIGQLVDRVAVPLLGLALVCLGQHTNRLKAERLALKSISWMTLIVAILFALLIPLNIVSSVRINRQNNQQLSAQINQASSQLKEAQAQVQNVGSLEQAEQLLVRFDPQSQAEIEPNLSLDEVKDRLTLSLARGERQIKKQAAAAQKNQLRALLKSSVKWNLSAIVSTALFFVIWRSMSWTRVGVSKS